MIVWEIPQQSYNLPRNIALLDTNVLVSMFNEEDHRHADTLAAIDLGNFNWIVSHAAIIESWNFLVGKLKRRIFASNMMEWLLTPGNIVLLGDAIENVETAHRYSNIYHLDVVDAGLIDIADRLTRACAIVPYVHVATYDTRDFLRLFGKPELNFNVYDMRDLSSTTGS